ncbi:MAG: queuosine precursor transporter [Caldisericia bacterium]|nr:queuosine precursor transporter [Caldisericia bacterium]MDD4614769.1 queuosine precursor transporter [Caldisericia bacterium]
MLNGKKLSLLFALFIGLLVGVNLLGGKVIGFFGISSSVGIFMVPLTFLITDIVEEVYGRETAGRFISGGIIVLIVIFAYTLIFTALPSHSRYLYNDEYRIIFGSSLRMIGASLVAFILSQYHDVWAFEFWKKRTQGKALWLRNNLSTIVSQGIDTFVFMMIAFYRISPTFTFTFVLQMSLPYYALKICFAILDTPFVYLGVKWLKKEASSTLSLAQE